MPLDPDIPFKALAGLQRVQPYDPIAVQTDIDRQRIYQAQAQKAQQEMQSQQRLQQLAQQYGDDPDELVKQLGSVDPMLAQKLGEQIGQARYAGAQAHLEQTKSAEAEIDSWQRLLQATDDKTWAGVRNAAVAKMPQLGSVLPPEYSDQAKQQALALGMSAKDWAKSQSEASQLYLDGKHDLSAARLYAAASTPQQRAIADDLVKQAGLGKFAQMFPDAPTAQQYLEAQQKADPEKAAKVGTFEDYVVRTYGPNPTPAQILAARKAYGQADDRPRVSVSVAGPGQQSDVKETVAGMKDGSLPPVLPGRATKEYNAIMAESHRQGFDLAKAAQDWQATSKYLGTLNGQQQTRLRQAVEQVQESVPLVRALVKEWDSAGIPVLSAANLRAAKAGTYGNKAQSLALRLDAQIADMTSELGTVYKGGNSSTDESLKLAAKNLGADWSKQAAIDALDQIEKNITYRKNSMKLGPVTDQSQQNRYAPDLGAVPSGAPDNVTSLLKSKGAGTYTLSDGSKWRKTPDGSVSKVQ